MNNQHQEYPVIIIGAGPAGLTAGYELLKLNRKSIVLEADTQVGGISKTINNRGNRFDIGGHRFFSKISYVNQLWHELLGEELLTCHRLSRIHYSGKFFDYPIKPIKTLKNLGLLETVRVILSYAKVKLSPIKKRDLTFEDWIVNRFGYRLYQIFFKTYTEKVWGIPCNEISADWAAQRIKNLSLTEAMKNAFKLNALSKDKVVTSLIEEFKYPRFGPGMMWETCQQKLDEADCKTHLNTRVKNLFHSNGKVEFVMAEDDAGNEIEFHSTQYISSMPLRHLVPSLIPSPPKHVLQAANSLRYRDFLTVVLDVSRKEVFPDNWIYIHTPEVKLGRIQNYKNWSRDMVKDTNSTTLGLEYFLWEKDEEWSWHDDELIELGISECVQIGLIKTEEVVHGTVVRMKKAYPVYDHSYQKNVNIIKEYLKQFDNLQTIGRNGLHRYNNQDHSMMTGVYAARNIVSPENDVWNVNVEQEYHESVSESKYSEGDRMVPTRVNRK